MKGGDVRGVETIMVTGLPFVESVAGLNKFLKIKAAIPLPIMGTDYVDSFDFPG